MPRGGKRGGARAPPRHVPHLRSGREGLDRRGLSSSSGPGFLPATASNGFTLQDEARSTAHRSTPWSSDSRLRHRPVAFVTTGSTEPLKQLEGILQQELVNQPDKKTDIVSTLSNDEANNVQPDEPPVSTSNEVPEQAPDEAPIRYATSTHVVDSATEPSLAADEDDAMEAVTLERDNNFATAETQLVEGPPAPLPFFLDVTGDKHMRDSFPIQVQTRSPSPTASDSSEEIILFRGRNKATGHKQKSKPFNMCGIHKEIGVVEKTVTPMAKTRLGIPMNGPGLTKHSHRDIRFHKRQEDDLIADYIANMREHGDEEGLVPVQAYSRRDIGGSLSESESVEEPFQANNAKGKPKAYSGGEISLDDTTLEVDAMPHGSDIRTRQNAQKRKKGSKAARLDDALLAVLETDASYLASLDQSHAEDASPHSESSDQDDIGDDVFASAADRFANEVDDFDFMDWDRPALKRKGKGARGKAPVFDISDTELEGKMQVAWKNDRLKKAERKRERQILRAQGLLGKHANPEDLRTKYPQGMGLEQIAEELKTFLLGSQPSLTLPPMDNQARKVIHELASKFNIKSKSTGSGDQRRPMLHRTFRTSKFADETFDMAIARVGRKYFPRNDTALRAAAHRQSARRGAGGGGHAGVLYRDGEVVGGSAPELSQENKGRAMLEKMGWSSGTALGALNNKGILQPVAHVVKRSKAGLG